MFLDEIFELSKKQQEIQNKEEKVLKQFEREKNKAKQRDERMQVSITPIDHACKNLVESG